MVQVVEIIPMANVAGGTGVDHHEKSCATNFENVGIMAALAFSVITGTGRYLMLNITSQWTENFRII